MRLHLLLRATLVLSFFALLSPAGTSFGQNTDCPGIDELVYSATIDELCIGETTTITTTSSQPGVRYFLRNDADDSVIDGPVNGNAGRNGLSFSTGSLSENTSFHIYAQRQTCSMKLATVVDITVGDTEAPELFCPGNIQVSTEPFSCGATVDFAAAATNNCGFELSYSIEPGEIFPLGTTTVTVTAEDEGGLVSTCSFDVIVVDNEAPVLTVPADITVSNVPGTCGAPATFSASATDNCGVNITYSHPSGSTFPVGTNEITVTATDLGGNTDVKTFNVIVEDTENPVVSGPNDITVDNAAGQCGAFVTFNASATDNCNVTLNSTNNSGDLFPVGTTNVVVTAIDDAGNTDQRSFNVTVVDVEAPVLSCPGNITVNNDAGACGAAVTFSASVTDNCGATIAYSHNSGDMFPVGTTTVTVTGTDAAGNSDVCSFNVTVVDNEAPVVTCPANITVNSEPGSCGASVNFAATVTDNCSATISYTHNSGDVFPAGTTTVRATATDASGNTSICEFDITVVDTEAPVINCFGPITASSDAGVCGAVVTFNVIATDNCGATVTYSQNSGSFFPVGTTTVVATATDISGNTANCSFDVVVSDNEAPTINCPADLVISNDAGTCGAVANFAATANDNCSATLSYSIASGTVFAVGTTPVTVTAVDPAGNTATCTFNVTVNDTEAPVVNAPADITASNDPGECGAVVLFEATTSDNCGATISYSHTSGTVFPVGTTAVTATATDASGNTSAATFNVTVVDVEAPVLSCPTDVSVNNDNGVCGAVVTFNVSASDNCGLTTTYSHNSGDVFPVGTTTVTATATDDAGNVNTCSFNVTVNDTEAPVANCNALTLTLNGGTATVDAAALTAGSTDNCGVDNVTLSQTTFTNENIGDNTVTVTLTDAAGNSTTCTATVTIEQSSNVTIDCPDDVVVDCDYSKGGANVYWPLPTASSDGGSCDPNTAIDGFIYMGEFNGHRYYCSATSSNTIQEAQAGAAAAGGYLVSINSQQENNFIKHNILANTVWIGFNDANQEGNFEWSNGDAVNYTNWKYSEPNNQGVGYNNCGDADHTVMKRSNGRWYDRQGCDAYEYVMEVPCSNSVTITQIGGPQPGDLFAGGTTTTITYVATDDETGATDTCSFDVTVNECQVEYCEVGGSHCQYEWIDNIHLGTINNYSGRDNGYADFTNQIAEAEPGDLINVTMTPGFYGGPWYEKWRVFVDWNLDGDFTDPGELVCQAAGYGTKHGCFYVPQHAANGDLRVRIVMRWNYYPAPCGYFNYGEAEDYTLRVANVKSAFNLFDESDDIVYVENEVGETEVGLEVNKVYPNPAVANDGEVTVEVRTAAENDAQLVVLDITGREIMTQSVYMREGVNQFKVDVSNLESGNYIVRVIGNGGAHSTKFTIQ